MLSKNLSVANQTENILNAIFYDIYNAANFQKISALDKDFNHVENYKNRSIETFKEIPIAYSKISKLFDLKNGYITNYRIDEDFSGDFYKIVFEGIALIEDVKFRNKVFNWVTALFKHYRLNFTSSIKIKKAMFNLYERKNSESLAFLRKKFPEINVSDAEFFSDLFWEEMKHISPSGKFDFLNSMLDKYQIKKVDSKNFSEKSSRLIFSLLRDVEVMPRNLPLAIKKALEIGDFLTLSDIKKIGSIIPENSNKKQILAELKDIFLDFIDKKDNFFSDINVFDISDISRLLMHYEESDQEKILSVIVPSEIECNSALITEILAKAAIKNLVCTTYKYKVCNSPCTLNEKQIPFFFLIVKRHYSDPNRCIKFLQNNDIDYHLINKDGKNIVEFIEDKIASYSEEDESFHNLNKIKAFCEIQQLNQGSSDEFNL